jgi:RHS repeat-associated protein
LSFLYTRNRSIKRAKIATEPFRDSDGNRAPINIEGILLTEKYVQGYHGLVKTLVSNIYYYQDELGSTSHIAYSSGALIESYQYDLYGKPRVYNSAGVFQPGATPVAKDLFTGQRWVPEIGLYDDRNRFMSPDLGRFLQPDPIGFKGDASNLYRYCGNDWANRSDPTGLVYIPNNLPKPDDPGPGHDFQSNLSANERVMEVNVDAHHVENVEKSRAEAASAGFRADVAKAAQQTAQAVGASRNPKVFQQNWYKTFGPIWNHWKNKIFGRDAGKVPDQTIGNAPRLDINHTNKQVAQIAGVDNPEAWGTNDSSKGPNGTIYLGREHFYNESEQQVNGTYGHELGNIVGDRYLGDPYAHGDPQPAGHPNFDRDVGAAFERRMFPGNLDD